MTPAEAVAQAAVADPTSGRAKTISFGSVQLPIPNWCVPLLGLVSVLYAASSLLGQPIQKAYSWYLSGKSEMQDQQEAYRHYSDVPIAEISQPTPKGNLEAKLYTDGCLSVAWRSVNSTAPPRPHFIRAVGTMEPPPTSAPIAVHQGVFTMDAAARALAGQLIGDGRPAGSGGTCPGSHPGEFQVSYGSRNGCWVQVWRHFRDGCRHYQWFNSCANVWDVNPDGSPRVFWTECRH